MVERIKKTNGTLGDVLREESALLTNLRKGVDYPTLGTRSTDYDCDDGNDNPCHDICDCDKAYGN